MACIGYVDEICRQMVSGWAADLDQPGTVVEVMVFVNDKPYARGPALIFRAGLVEVVQSEITNPELKSRVTGSYGFSIRLEPPLSVFEEQKIEVRAGKSATVLPNGSRRLARPPTQETQLLPVLLTAIGRSGTTVMMQKLAAHDEIVIAPLYPYEIKLMSYYSAAFRTLVASADREKSTRPDMLFSEGSECWIGHNPYNRPGIFQMAGDPPSLEQVFDSFVPGELARTFRAIIDRFYGVLRRDLRKTGARFFVEKCDLHDAARQGPRMLFGGVREIVVTRDPRDLLCSAKSFWKSSTEDAIQRLRSELSRLVQIRATVGGDVLFVRYEDLVRDGTKTMSSVYRFLGLASPEAAGDAEERSLFQIHGTSKSPVESIGRWRTDLTGEEIASIGTKFDEFLRIFDYQS